MSCAADSQAPRQAHARLCGPFQSDGACLGPPWRFCACSAPLTSPCLVEQPPAGTVRLVVQVLQWLDTLSLDTRSSATAGACNAASVKGRRRPSECALLAVVGWPGACIVLVGDACPAA